MRPTRVAVALLALAAACGVAALASAQRADPRAPSTFTVGQPQGASPTDRVDARRSGVARTALPAGALRVAWRKSLGIPIEHAPMVTADGTVLVLTSRGDVYAFDDSGDERWRSTSGLSAASGPALLADGTVAFATPSGDLVGARAGQRRFQTHLPGDRPARVTPVALGDGGLALAVFGDVLFVDGDGQARARSALPEPLTAGLVALGGKLYGVAPGGVVYAATPGREAARVGSFGGVVDRGIAALSDRTLVAIVDTSRVVELDLVSGLTQVRATALAGHLLGPPAVRGGLVYAMAQLPGRTYVVAYDGAGNEVKRAQIATFPPPVSLDGGPTALPVPPHTGVLVDGAGTVAFVAPDGAAGVVSDQGGVDTVGETVCTRALGRAQNASGGLAPAGPGAFYVACEGGQLVKISGK